MFQFITDCILYIYHLFFKTKTPSALTTNESQVNGEKYQDVRDDTIPTPINEKVQERIKAEEKTDKESEIPSSKETLSPKKLQESESIKKREFSSSPKESVPLVKPEEIISLKQSPKEVPQVIRTEKPEPSLISTKDITKEIPPVKELQKEVLQEKPKLPSTVTDFPKESPHTLKEVPLTKEINNKEDTIQNNIIEENGSKKGFDQKGTKDISSDSEEEIIEDSDEEELNRNKSFEPDILTTKGKIAVVKFKSDDIESGSEEEVEVEVEEEDEEY